MSSIGMVLIHGAGLNSSIWDDLIKEMNQDLLPIDFPNRKTGGDKNQSLTFDDYVNSTIEQIRNWNKDNFILVAHSIGACVALKVALHFKKELKGLVAIGAVTPTSGNSFASALPFPQRIVLPIILKLLGTRPPAKSIEQELCNDLSLEQTKKVTAEFTPEAKTLYTTKIIFDLPNTRRLYIKLTNDKSIPPALQDTMAKKLSADKVLAINSGHLPMLSKPTELASVLSGFINEVQ